ncbi:hypothetical protein PsorP6_018925 [Peronosclerospora sorghi]|nr:hypothetical protein PsorP6_018925 [Peronosclerospora sorghi]
MAVLLTLAVSTNNHALSASVSNELAEVTRDRDTVAPDDGKRSLRVKERTAETLDEDRMEGPFEPVISLFRSQIEIYHEQLRGFLLKKWEEIENKPEYLFSSSVGARTEWLRYFMKKALEDVGVTPDDAMISSLFGEPHSMDDLIKLWGLESDETVKDRTRLLRKEHSDVPEDRRTSMAIGSIYLEKRTFESWNVPESSDDELSGLVIKDDELLEKLELDRDEVRLYALVLLQNERFLPEIPVIIDMAIGGAYFKVFRRKHGFNKMKNST